MGGSCSMSALIALLHITKLRSAVPCAAILRDTMPRLALHRHTGLDRAVLNNALFSS